MPEQHILVVDDLRPKREYLRSLAVASAPYGAVIHDVATTAQAYALIKRYHKKIVKGFIDYDIGKGGNGADVTRELRKESPCAHITLATAREGDSFEEARGNAMNAGADAAWSTCDPNFEQSLAA